MSNIPQQNTQVFRNVFLPGDTNGCGFWRFLQAVYSMYCLPPQAKIENSIELMPPSDPHWWASVNMVMVQRCTTQHQLDFMMFLDAIRKQNGMTIIYNIDDCMHPDEIPLQNKGREHYVKQETQACIKRMLSLSDIVIVTTDRIRQYYISKYSLAPDKVKCVPNLLPRWWIDGKFDPRKKVEDFKAHKKSKLKIGVVSSASHWNLEKMKDADGNVIKDDFDEIADVVKSTCCTFEWHIVGHCPHQVEDEVKRGLVKIDKACPILNYPEYVRRMDLDAIVVPCDPSLEFNKCKANIKWLEGCALGVPVIAEAVDPVYVKHMPEKQLFKDQAQLKSILLDLQTMSDKRFFSIIESQWKFLNSSAEEAGHSLKSWWLEDNLNIWLDICSIPQKMTAAKMQWIEAQKKMMEAKQEVLWQNEDGSCKIVS